MAKRLSKQEYAKQKQAEMKKTIDDAMDKISNYKNDPEDFVQYLDFMSNMYDYSPRNQMLLINQYEGAYGVAGKRQFEEMGFKVHENEKALKVLAPVFKKYTIDENKKWIPLDRPTKSQKDKIESGEYKVKQKLSYFKFADVYDIGQTDAKAEDYPKMFPNRPYTFDERNINEKYPNLKSSIKSFAEKEGYHLIDELSTEYLGNAKGAYSPSTNNIYMRPHLSDGEYLSTLNHEVAHGQLHKNSSLDTPTKELEAEMTAYVTNKHFGLDTSDKAISYMATWTKNLSELSDKETIKVIERVSKASRRMITGIEDEYAKENELTKEQEPIQKSKYPAKEEWIGKKESEISHLRIGDMSFDYQNLQNVKLKDFTILNEVDSLKIGLKDGTDLSVYNNKEEKDQFNRHTYDYSYSFLKKNYKNLSSGGENINVDKLDITMKDYMNYTIEKNKGYSDPNRINNHVEKYLQNKIDRRKSKNNNIEI